MWSFYSLLASECSGTQGDLYGWSTVSAGFYSLLASGYTEEAADSDLLSATLENEASKSCCVAMTTGNQGVATASYSSDVDTCPRASIRCSPASTAELASSAPRLCSRPLLFAARQRVQRNPKRDTSRTTCAFLFAARQRVQRNVNQATVPAGYVPLLFAARQRVQRNCPPDDRGPLAPPGFYSLLASEYSGT